MALWAIRRRRKRPAGYQAKRERCPAGQRTTIELAGDGRERWPCGPFAEGESDPQDIKRNENAARQGNGRRLSLRVTEGSGSSVTLEMSVSPVFCSPEAKANGSASKRSVRPAATFRKATVRREQIPEPGTAAPGAPIVAKARNKQAANASIDLAQKPLSGRHGDETLPSVKNPF